MSGFTIFGTLFYVGLMGAQIAFMMPILPFQWAILAVVLGNFVRAWIGAQKLAAYREATWGKYDRPGDDKVPTYHEL